jgi:hypothetical protein
MFAQPMDPSIIGWKEECEREHKANELLRAAINDLPARETGLGIKRKAEEGEEEEDNDDDDDVIHMTQRPCVGEVRGS